MKPFLEHVAELRKRFLFIFVSLIFFFALSYPTTPFFVDLLKSSASRYEIDLNIFKITESVSIYIRIMFFQAVCLSFPVISIQIFQFIKPTLSARTKKAAVLTIPVLSLLFALGAILGYKVFVPFLLNFFLAVSKSVGVNTIFGFMDYFHFVFAISLVFGLLLELPAILCFLTYLGVITPRVLRKHRKFIYPVLCLIALLVTPPELVSELIVTSLMFLLYEISVIASVWISKLDKKERTEVDMDQSEVVQP